MTDTPLVIKKAVFYKSMKKQTDSPAEVLPEIAFAGKSNAGKSSLINYLANHSKLAYVSKQPGKTRLINYFLINDSFYLVDLPGYGYARVSREERHSWGAMMRDYFDAAKELRGVVVLTDIRHAPSEDDLQMIEWALHYHVPFLVVATKADKIAKSKRRPAAWKLGKYIADALKISAEFAVIPVSALGKQGKEELLLHMRQMLTGEEA